MPLPNVTADVVIAPQDGAVRPTDAPPADAPGLDAGASDAAPPGDRGGFDVDPNRAYPFGPVGGDVGFVVSRFTFPDCSGGAYDFGGPEFLRTRATVLAVFTGTCEGCTADAQALQAIHAAYAGRGVRVVAVLVEGGAPMEQPSPTFCAQWRTSVGASHAVLIDVTGSLDYLNPLRRFPLVLVTDAGGVIRGRFSAQAGWAAAARGLLDALAP